MVTLTYRIKMETRTVTLIKECKMEMETEMAT